MDRIDKLTIEGLDRLYPGSVWDVLPGLDAPEDMPICVAFGSVCAAVEALYSAGFRPTAYGIPAPRLDQRPYDFTTMLRFSAGGNKGVVVVRRL